MSDSVGAESNLARFELNDGHFCEVCVEKMSEAFIGGVIVGHDLATFEPGPNLRKIDRLEYLASLHDI
jgi:hypothetical protein